MEANVQLLIDSIEKVIVGKTDIIKKVISSLLCDGHILIEDVPGVGKTQLVASLARSLHGKFNRIQMIDFSVSIVYNLLSKEGMED